MNFDYHYTNLPQFYDLQLIDDYKIVRFIVASPVYETYGKLFSIGSPGVRDYQEQFGFTLPTQEQRRLDGSVEVGFERCGLLRLGEQHVQIDFDLSIAGGKGDDFWKYSKAIIATLHCLLTICDLAIYEYREEKFVATLTGRQKMFLTFNVVKDGAHSICYIAVHVLAPLVEFLKKQVEHSRIKSVDKTMLQVSRVLRAGSNMDFIDSSRTYALFRQPQWVNLTVPGNACGLDPEDYDVDDTYRLVPHNVDSPIQMFTLLAGVIEICRLSGE